MASQNRWDTGFDWNAAYGDDAEEQEDRPRTPAQAATGQPADHSRPDPNDPLSSWYPPVPPMAGNEPDTITTQPVTDPNGAPATDGPKDTTPAVPGLNDLYNWIQYTGQTPGSDPSATNDTNYWMGAINNAGGLNEGNRDYWATRINSDPNAAPGSRGYYDQEDARRAAGSGATTSAGYAGPVDNGVLGLPSPFEVPVPSTPATNIGGDTPAIDDSAPANQGFMGSSEDVWRNPAPLPSTPAPVDRPQTPAAPDEVFGAVGVNADGSTTPVDTPDTDATAHQELINTLRQRIGQSTAVNPFDPTIRPQVDAYSARRQAATQNQLRAAAEAAGPYTGTNLSSETRHAYEAEGQDTAGFEAGLVANELTARRNEIQSSLSQLAGVLSADETRDLQERLANLNAAIQREQMKESGRQFDTTNTRLDSQYDQSLAEQVASRLQQREQFGLSLDEQRAARIAANALQGKSLSQQDRQFLMNITQRAYEFDTSEANDLFGGA